MSSHHLALRSRNILLASKRCTYEYQLRSDGISRLFLKGRLSGKTRLDCILGRIYLKVNCIFCLSFNANKARWRASEAPGENVMSYEDRLMHFCSQTRIFSSFRNENSNRFCFLGFIEQKQTQTCVGFHLL